MFRPATLLLASAFAMGTLMTTACAQTPPPATIAPDNGTLLSVSARAEASRVPDVASMSTGVITQAADANAALKANSAQMTRVVDTIKAAGIADKDIQTSGIGIHPEYRYAQNQPPKITGYQANNTVNIKVRDLARLSEVLDALVASGANQVHGPNFEIDQPEAVYDEARRSALKIAQERADMYASTLGLRVRRIVSINEGGGFAQPKAVMMLRTMSADAEAASAPVAPGQTTLSVNLDVVFELGR